MGPIWRGGGRGEDALLASCYRRSLALAIERGIGSVAFPAISTGVYRFPLERATRIAVQTVTAVLSSPEGAALERVIFCCFSERAAEVYRAVLGEGLPPSPKGE